MQQARHFVLRCGDNLIEHLVRIIISRLYAFEVHHSQAAQLAHLPGELRRPDSVHRGGEHWSLQCYAVNREVSADQLRVDSNLSRHDCDFIESIYTPQFRYTRRCQYKTPSKNMDYLNIAKQ